MAIFLKNDMCGLGSIAATWFIVFYVGTYTTITCVIPLQSPFKIPFCFFFYGLVFMSLWSHVKAVITDPGRIQSNMNYQSELEQQNENCNKCNIIRPPMAHHCSICGFCIIKMDHHCPWINNCCGWYTQKHFILFCFYIATSSMIAILLMISNAFSGLMKQEDQLSLGLLSFILALLFFIFVIIMLTDQFESIFKYQGYIDRLQKKKTPFKSFKDSIEETFGGKFGWKWFVPLDVPPPKYYF